MHSQESAGLIDSPTGGPTGGWVRAEPPAGGIERIQAFFRGQVYAPHRHDVYAIGMTETGVQSFAYRGEAHHSLPGRVIVLHPDEVHDGGAGTEDGFRYRMLYLDPALVGSALGGGPLPFVPDAVSDDPRLQAAVTDALRDVGEAVDDFRRDEIVLSVAEALAAAGGTGAGVPRIDHAAVTRAGAYLTDNIDRAVGNEDLEAVSGLDRWTLARQFRAATGTSPYRYFVMRRLDRVRAMIAAGATLGAGFADQAHMTRHFTRAYGLPPGRWARLCSTT